MGRLLSQLSPTEKQSVLLSEKRKSILNVFNECLTNGEISHFFTSIGHQIYDLKKFNFSILYSGCCSLLPCYLYATVPVLWTEILDQFLFFVNKTFLSYAFSTKELWFEYFEYLNLQPCKFGLMASVRTHSWCYKQMFCNWFQ